MSAPTSYGRAVELIRLLARRGVDTWCVAPGGRNAPVAIALARAASEGLTVFTFFEERAAAFFALGRARATERPVAVATTSGTAAAELLPAAIEAHYTGAPIALVTADRPHRMRHTGAPQAIDQRPLFASYAPVIDLDASDPVDAEATRSRLTAWRRGPLHLNVAFDEPLLAGSTDRAVRIEVGSESLAAEAAADDETARATLGSFLGRARRPLVLAGTLSRREAPAVRDFLLRLGAPVVAEATSLLHADAALASTRLEAPEKTAARALDDFGCDGVLRLGGVPTIRVWRDLDGTRASVPVCSLSALPFPGLARGECITTDFARFLPTIGRPAREDPSSRELFAEDRAIARSIAALLDEEPKSEPALVRALSREASGLVFLGNSLPIREWDAFAVRTNTSHVMANRGTNGIDGQLSTAFGAASVGSGGAPGRELWTLVGDLTALYDLAAPWVLPQLDLPRLRIAIVNNRGGRIFDRIFGEPALRNAHAYDFRAWAEMWGLDYARRESADEHPALADRTVLEIVPDEAATERFWRRYDGIDAP